MVPIQEAINSQAWLRFSNDGYLRKWSPDEPRDFRVRVLEFYKIDLAEVDDPEEVDVSHENASWWMLKLEVVSLCKRKIFTSDFYELALLVDQDNFGFNCLIESHLYSSEFGKKTGLYRFWRERLFPKIKAVGALTFLLPDDEEAQYSLSMDNGKVEEA